MSFTYDLSSSIGRIRLRISDTSSDNYIFNDEELAVFFDDEGSNVKRACAAALEAIAVNEALVQKVIKNLQLSTDGAKLADSLLKQAANYRAQADSEDLDAIGGFEIAEQIHDTFTYEERLLKEILRKQM